MPTRSAFALVALLALAAPAFAQEIPKAPGDKPWVATVISIVLIMAVCVASFMGSKRGHQD